MSGSSKKKSTTSKPKTSTSQKPKENVEVKVPKYFTIVIENLDNGIPGEITTLVATTIAAARDYMRSSYESTRSSIEEDPELFNVDGEITDDYASLKWSMKSASGESDFNFEIHWNIGQSSFIA